MKPGHTLLFLGAVLGALALIGLAIPESGMRLGALELDFPDPRGLISSAQEKKVDISDIIALEVDSLTGGDTLVTDTPKVPIKGMIAYPNDDPGMLRPALAALNAAANSRELQDKFAPNGFVTEPGSAAALGERNRLETVKWEKAIREAKIEPQ